MLLQEGGGVKMVERAMGVFVVGNAGGGPSLLPDDPPVWRGWINCSRSIDVAEVFPVVAMRMQRTEGV